MPRMLSTTIACALFGCAGTLLGACGGTQASAAPTTPEPAAPPPVPAEPLQLIPQGAVQLLRVDLEALRTWSEYARLSPLAADADCERGPELLALLDRFDRAAFAGIARDGQPEGGLLVARGRAEGMTAEEVLASAAPLLKAKPAATTRTTIGRFEVVTDGTLSAAILDGQVLVVGDAASVEAALGLALTQGNGSIAHSERVQSLALSEHIVGGFVLPTSTGGRELAQATGRVGGRAVADPLSAAATGFHLDLAESLRLVARVEFESPQVAGDMMGNVQQMTAQATMFLRMFRLPPLAERLDVSIEDRTLVLVLELPPGEVARVSTLAETTFKPPACPDRPAAAPATATTPAPAAAAGGGGT